MIIKRSVFVVLTLMAFNAHGALVTGGIIPAPPSVDPNGATSQSPQGFDERQNVRLTADLVVDNRSIPAGTVVSSHMVFLNPGSQNTINYNGASFGFDNEILGVMSDTNGQLEGDSSQVLGAVNTIYPTTYAGRGLEHGTRMFPFGTENYSFSGTVFRVNLRAGRGDGDYIRVITAGTAPACTPPAHDVLVCDSGCDYNSVQSGINAAANGQTILVLAGVYNESISLSGGKVLLSCEGPASTVLDASGLESRVVNLSGNASIEGFTIQGGQSNSGAGVYSSGGTVSDNIITNNVSSQNGGGIATSSYSRTYIYNNVISNNTASNRGGGIMNSSYATMEFEDNTVENNQAVYGGGVYFVPYGTLVFEGNRVRSNSATYGGGIYTPGYSGARIINNIVTNNEASTAGGGIYSTSYSYAKIVNSTLFGNKAPFGSSVGVSSYCGVIIANTVMWGNDGFTINRPRYGAAQVKYSIVQNGYSGVGNVDADPQFVNPAGGDFSLLGNSPAIDAGGDPSVIVSSSITVADDFYDVVRPQDGDSLGSSSTGDGSDYDIGAVEASAR